MKWQGRRALYSAYGNSSSASVLEKPQVTSFHSQRHAAHAFCFLPKATKSERQVRRLAHSATFRDTPTQHLTRQEVQETTDSEGRLKRLQPFSSLLHTAMTAFRVESRTRLAQTARLFWESLDCLFPIKRTGRTQRQLSFT